MTEKLALAVLDEDEETGERPLGPALRRGFMCRCPKCGAGPLLKNYLTVRDHCPVCGEAFYHHRADDGPAYLTILIVGHLMAPTIYWVFVTWRPEPMVMATLFTLGTAVLALALLPRLKGAIVALQWAKRMHGFAMDPRSDPALPDHA
jgi:uncharacterized protein (DUF983 family)